MQDLGRNMLDNLIDAGADKLREMGGRFFGSHGQPGIVPEPDALLVVAYAEFGLRPDAEPEVVEAAHRAMMRKYHPDKGGDPERTARLNQAWAIIKPR